MKDPVKYYTVITDLVENKQFEIGAWSTAGMIADILSAKNSGQIDFKAPHILTHVYSVPFDFNGVYEIEKAINAIRHFP